MVIREPSKYAVFQTYWSKMRFYLEILNNAESLLENNNP